MRIKALSPWIEGNESITPFNFFMKENPCWEKGAFLSLDEAVELYMADTVNTGNLQDSWEQNQEYIIQACEIGQYESIEDAYEHGFDLDNEQKRWILSELGKPPYCSYNIYIVTIYNEVEEKVVYVGKTDSQASRYKNGHKVALKLHNPKYKNYYKRVYFGTIMFLSEQCQYIPLEFITPLEKAKGYLSNFEARLINHFRPELNSRREQVGELKDISIHIQNFSKVSGFLNDYFIQ